MAEQDESSVYHPDNHGVVELVTLFRIYDLLAVIARGINREEAKKVIDAHGEGIILMPDVAVYSEEE